MDHLDQLADLDERESADPDRVPEPESFRWEEWAFVAVALFAVFLFFEGLRKLLDPAA